MSIITITLKRLGKKKIKQINIVLEKSPQTLKDLIVECVTSEWNRFKQKTEDSSLIPFLSTKDVKANAETGKVGFGDMQNRENIPLQNAIDNAILAFEDGLFVVFIDDEELKHLTDECSLKPTSVLTFIRLTFLTGTYWS